MNITTANPKTILKQITLVALSLLGLLVINPPIQTTAMMHDTHASAVQVSESIDYNHAKDCASACGVVDGSEDRQYSISKRKKEREKQPDKPQHHTTNNTGYFTAKRHRTVHLEDQNKTYLEISLIRV